MLLTGLSGIASADPGSRYLNVLVTADGSPLDGVEVTLLQWDDVADDWVDTGVTVPQEGTGFYMTQVVGTGRYTVRLHDPEDRWADAYGVGTATPPALPTADGTFAVTGEFTRNAMIVTALSGDRWTPGISSGIQGVVRDRAGELVDGILVEAYAVGAPDVVAASSITYGIQDWRQGPNHGFYSLVVPPGDYVVRFSDLEDRFVSFDHADGPVAVYSNDWIRPAATVIPLGVAPSDLHGVVQDAEGQPLDGILVEAYRADEPDVTVASALTYASDEEGGPEHGFYRLAVGAGEYGVRFSSLPDADPAYRTALHPDAPVVVGEGESIALAPVALISLPVSHASAQVLLPSGAVLPYPRATVYSWDEGSSSFVMTHRERGDVDGHVSVRLPFDVPAVVKIGRPGMVGWYTTGETLPTGPESTGVIVGDGDVDLGEIRLLPRLGVLGQSAGDMAEYCTTRYLYRNDDRSTRRVPLPSELNFFGARYDGLYINNNGNVTFNGPAWAYTPGDLTGDRGEDGPIIAPFFADVDTRGARSNVVTYGFSPDGTKLCVNWAGVGFYSHRTVRLNTFQLVLDSGVTGDGRLPGDFDITFNYDRVTWEAGQASGSGPGGLGGTSAAVGYSAGTGEPGTFVQLPGSFDNGALLDGGSHALVSGSQGAATPGRYLFQVRNDGAEHLGAMHGSVQDSDGGPVAGALVEACPTAGGSCTSLTPTGPGGSFSFSGLRVGGYRVNVSPPAGSTLFPSSGTATVTTGGNTVVDPIVLRAPQPIAEGITLVNSPSTGTGASPVWVTDEGLPVVNYRADLDLVITGCPEVTDPSYSMTLNGVVIRSDVPMTESPAGTYSVTVQRTHPAHGDAEITTNVPTTCGGQPTGFDLYIDPSGVVTDQYGRPIQGATVTLRRSDSQAGPYTAVPNGSPIMSPSNRSNPDTTDAIGFFQWDVVTGWYKVSVDNGGCDSTATPAMQVPPERLDLLVKMQCTGTSGPAPVSAPVLSGTERVGQTLTVSAGTWPFGLERTRTQWLRGGNVVATGSSYTLQGADAGQVITARVLAARPSYTQENGTGDVVTFAESSVDVASGTIAAAPGGGGGGGSAAPVNSTVPTVAGVAKVGQLLTSNPGTWNTTGLTFTYQWLRDGEAIAGATSADYRAVVGDLGHAVAVKVTTVKAGTPSATAVSAAVTIAKGDAAQVLSEPTVTGGTAVGDTLSVSEGSWSIDGLSFTYQWLRDGEAIAGETGATHVVAAQDQGTSLSALVTATRAGYEDGSVETGSVSVPVEPGPGAAHSRTRARLADGTITRTQHPRLDVQVTSPADAPVVGRVAIRVDGHVVKTVRLGSAADGHRSVRLPRQSVGTHMVRAVYLGSPQVRSSRSDALRLRVRRASAHRPMPTLL